MSNAQTKLNDLECQSCSCGDHIDYCVEFSDSELIRMSAVGSCIKCGSKYSIIATGWERIKIKGSEPK